MRPKSWRCYWQHDEWGQHVKRWSSQETLDKSAHYNRHESSYNHRHQKVTEKKHWIQMVCYVAGQLYFITSWPKPRVSRMQFTGEGFGWEVLVHKLFQYRSSFQNGSIRHQTSLFLSLKNPLCSKCIETFGCINDRVTWLFSNTKKPFLEEQFKDSYTGRSKGFVFRFLRFFSHGNLKSKS